MSRSPYIGLHVAVSDRRATAADIVTSVRRQIETGALPAGSRLPPVRALEKPAFIGVPHLHGFRVAYAYLPEQEMRHDHGRRDPSVALRFARAGRRPRCFRRRVQ